MYNRYIRNDDGIYSRIPEEEPNRTPPPPPPEPQKAPQQPSHQTPPCKQDGLTGIFRNLLDQFHLNSIDSGDLLLLGLLFFLYRESADEELLAALGLLLIL